MLLFYARRGGGRPGVDGPKKLGPMPTGRRWRGLPVPFFFQAPCAEAFRQLEVRADDVVLSSLVKGGTTWVHKCLYLLLHGVDDSGKVLPADGIGAVSQVYPESTCLRHGAACDPLVLPDADARRQKIFGPWSFEEDLCGQASPRLFSTHVCGDNLPAQLIDPGPLGKGRLVVVLRNLKDVLASNHFFQGEAKDGWHGNEHGPGSLARYIHPDSPNAYGSPFSFVRKSDETVAALQATGRVLVVYYEDLKNNLPAQVDRMAAFLNVNLTAAKRSAVTTALGFEAMKAAGGVASITLRKGEIGDWKRHMKSSDWQRFDEAFDAALDGVPIAEPLRFYQMAHIDGLPPPRKEHSLCEDPRTWPNFVRKTLVEGHVVRDTLISATTSGRFQRPPSEFTGTVVPPGAAGKHVAEAGRYHLFVSGVCPWASGVRATRYYMGLEDVISMDIADGQSGAGWVFVTGTTCPPWATRGESTPFFLHEAYQAADPYGTTRITVPVLWDKQLGCIVSNDSWAIVKILATAFRPLAKPNAPSLWPGADAKLLARMEDLHADLYARLLNGVYKSGVAYLKGSRDVAQSAAEEVYQALDGLEKDLASRRFLLGTPGPSVVDIRLVMTLLRYDASYRFAFALQGGRGGVLVGPGYPSGYPVLGAYVRDVYSRIKPTVDWSAFPQYYRWTKGHPTDQALPDLSAIVAAADKPHGREHLK